MEILHPMGGDELSESTVLDPYYLWQYDILKNVPMVIIKVEGSGLEWRNVFGAFHACLKGATLDDSFLPLGVYYVQFCQSIW